MQRAVAYCRVSDPRQVNDDGSLARQEAEAVKHAHRNGYVLDRVFIERGESAKTDSRRELKRMLASLRSSRADVLIIPKIDRLARNSHDYLTLKLTLSKLGTRIESVGEALEDNPVGRFLETVLAGTAQLDNEIRAERSRDGLIDAFKKGRWVWRAPYGYEHRDGNIVPKEPEASIVRKIFELSETLNGPDILREVRQMGCTLKKSRLHEILQAPVYAGQMRAFGMDVEGAFVPLVPARRVHRTTNQREHRANNPDFPLKQSVRCCGPMTGSWSKGRSSAYAYYRCRGCGRHFQKEALERGFCQFLQGSRVPEQAFPLFEKRVRLHWQQLQSDHVASAANAGAELSRVKALQRSLALKNAAGVIPDDIATEQIQELRQRESELNERAEAPLLPIDDALKFARRILINPADFWRACDQLNRLRFQNLIFPEGLTVQQNLRFGTKKMRLLQPANRLARPHGSGLEHQSGQCPNSLLDDIRAVHATLTAPEEEGLSGVSSAGSLPFASWARK